MLLKPLAGSGPTLSKHPFLHRNIIVRNVWRVAQKSYRIEHFGRVETHVAFFCGPRFLHTSNGFSMILTHVKCDFGCHGAKSLFLHKFYKQNEIACIFRFGVVGGELRARFVRVDFSAALKPQRGSKYYAETSLFVF